MQDTHSDALPGGGVPVAELRHRMEETERRCRAEGLPFFLLAIGYAGERRMEAEEPGIKPRIHAALLARIQELPRADEFLVDLEAGRLLVVIPDMPTEAAEVIAQLLIAGARELTLEGESEPRRVSLEIGIAEQQDRELFFETLVLVASEGVQVAHARGGECAIHSELYGLLQNRLERQRREAQSDQPLEVAAEEVAAQLEEPVEADPILEAPAVPDEREKLAAQLQALVARDAPRRSKREVEAELKRAAEVYAAEAVAKVEAERRRLLASGEITAPPAPESAAASITVPQDSGQVERLERRLKKLLSTLEETERRLDEVSRTKGVELGVPSAYRGVQGLSSVDKDFDLKRDMMRELLDANIKLRKQLGGSGSAA
jgi:hypothetical protein